MHRCYTGVLQGCNVPSRLCELACDAVKRRESEETSALVGHTDGPDVLGERRDSDLSLFSKDTNVPVYYRSVSWQRGQVVILTESGTSGELGGHVGARGF